MFTKKRTSNIKLLAQKKNVLKGMSAKHFFEIQKELPFEFTKQFFSPRMNGFVSINIDDIVDYLKQYDGKELDKLIEVNAYYKDWSDKLVIAESFVRGRTHKFLSDVIPTENMTLSYDSDLYRLYKELGQEDKFMSWALWLAERLIKQKNDAIKYIDEEIIRDFPIIILSELDYLNGLNFLLGLSKTIKRNVI